MKIVQFQVVPESESTSESLYWLDSNGKLYQRFLDINNSPVSYVVQRLSEYGDRWIEESRTDA